MLGPLVAADPNLPFGLVFMACENGIKAINGTNVWTIVPSAVPGCPNPQRMDVHDGVLYAICSVTGQSDPDTPTAVQVNFTNNDWVLSTIATFEQCAGPQGLQMDRFNGRVYVLCWKSIITIDGTQVSPFVPYDMCHYPSAVSAAASTHGGDIVVSCATDSRSPSQPSRLLGVNPITGNTTVIVDFGAECQNPTAIVPDLESGTLYVACFGDTTPKNRGSVVAVLGNTVSTLLPDCSTPSSLAFDPVTGFVFLNCGTTSVVAFHPSAPAATLTTLVQADRCENARSMQILPSSLAKPTDSSAYPNQSSFSLLIGCRNSDIVMLVSGAISMRVSDFAVSNMEPKFMPRG